MTDIEIAHKCALKPISEIAAAAGFAAADFIMRGGEKRAHFVHHLGGRCEPGARFIERGLRAAGLGVLMLAF